MAQKYQISIELGCLHPVACTRSGSGSGFPSNVTLFEYLFSIFIQLPLHVSVIIE
jgi:hypothetical protein